MKSKSKKEIILIVEDMLENIHLLSQLLKKQGYDIHTVQTGMEALEFVKKQIPDLILLDIVLPDIDGFEVCSRIKNNPSTEGIPVIFISALTKTEDILHGFSVGSVDYVTKPFIAEQVLARVSTQLKMSDMRNQLVNQTVKLQELNQQILKEGKAETQEKINELKQLSNTTSALLEIDTIEGIYQYLEEFIYPLSGADYLMVVGYEEHTKMTYAKQIYGIESVVKHIIPLLGKDFMHKQISTNDWVTRLSLEERKNVYQLEGGLYELTEHTLSKTVCFGLEKLMGIREMFAIGFIWDEKYYGGIAFGFKKGKKFSNRSLVESIIHQTSLAMSRIEAKEQLNYSEEKYRSIFEHTGNATMIVDDKANIILANDKCLSITGYSPTQLIGTRWTKYVAPESLQGLKEYSLNRLNKSSEIAETYEAHLIDANNQTRIVKLSVGLIPESKNSVVSMLDITGLKNAQKEVVKNEQKYRSVFENIQDVYFETKLDGTIIELSPSIQLLSKNQYKREDLLGKSLYDFYLSKNGQTTVINLLKNGERVHDFEINLKNKDGSILTCSLSANIHLDPIGKFQKIVGTFHDITDRKKAEELLIESEKQYKSLVEKGHVGIGIDDKDGKITYANKQFLELFGYSEEETINKKHQFFIHPDEYDRISEFHNKRIKGEKLPNRYEVKALRKDGTEIYIEIDVTEIIENESEVIGTISYLWDITDRKKAAERIKSSEEKFNTAFDMAPVAMTLQDTNGIFLEVNKAFVELMGYSKEEAIGYPAKNLKLWADEAEREHALTSFQNQGFFNRNEFKFRKKSGEFGYGIISSELISLGEKSAELTTVLDITQRKIAQDKVLKLSQAVEQSPVSILITDTNGIIEYCNPKIIEVTGYSLNELIGENPRIFSSGQKTRVEYKKLWATISSGNEWKGEFHNKKKNGELYWEMASISPILNEKGKITHYLAVKEDITEKKLADQALRNSEYKYQTLAKISPVGIFRTDANGYTTYVNPTWCAISGLSYEDALGDGWLKRVHPDDRKTLSENWQKSVKKEAVSLSEYRFIRSDESIAWVIGKAVPELDADGKLIGYVGTATDISEHKKLESTKEILINISNALLATENLHDFSSFIFNELGKVIKTNNFYIALYQKETQMFSTPFIKDSLETDLTEFPVGKTMTGFVIHTRKSQIINKERFASLVQSGEIELLGPPSDVWIGVPLFINDKVIGAIVIQNYDGEKRLDEEDLRVLEYAAPQISLAIERKRTLEDLKSALEKAQESDRLKSAFLANMSHEIRTPMNGILGFTELLKEPQLSGEQQQEFIEVIERSGARMLNTIRDLIDISTIESGQANVLYSETDMREQMEQIASFFRPEIENKGLQLQLKLPDGESTMCLTDSEKVYAILSNLTKNAIKYSKKGTIEIGCNKEKDCLQFFVKDEGIGIPKDKLDSVFDRFVQADSRLSSDYEGVGLGLSITKAYVTMLGGKIWVESVEGVGTTFYFTIARDQEKIVENKQPLIESEKTVEIESKAKAGKLKILLVEDDKMSQQLIKFMISSLTKSLIIANNGIEAVELAKRNPDIDLILMDMKMPEMDGFEATRLIRQFNAEVVIIAQTAYSMIGDREKTLAAGCTDYISKPIHKTEFLDLLASYFGNK